MVNRSISSPLTVFAIVALSVLAGCSQPEPSGSSTQPVRNPQGQLVDPQTGIPLPGQGTGAGGAGY